MNHSTERLADAILRNRARQLAHVAAASLDSLLGLHVSTGEWPETISLARDCELLELYRAAEDAIRALNEAALRKAGA